MCENMLSMRNNLVTRIVIFFLVFFWIIPQSIGGVWAATTVSTALHDTYRLTDTSTVQVERSLTFTNQVPDLYVNQYLFSFRNTQQTHGLVVEEDGQIAQFKTERNGELLEVTVTLRRPAIGIGKTKTITMRYTLSDYLQESGLYKELIIAPSRVSEDEDVRDYIIDVISPPSYPLVSIAKPLGQKVSDHQYRWSGVHAFDGNNLYLAYGQEALYQLELQYAIQNKYPYPRSYSIPFPPDGAWQQIIIDEVQPEPDKTYRDEDDNFMATYTVPANGTVNVIFNGVARLTSDVRVDVQSYMRKRYTASLLTSRYLSQQPYWTLSGVAVPAFANQKEMYDYIIQTLSYDDSRIDNSLKRMGATWALSNPEQAVCMEYTDLFIALARENNLPAREVVGYGIAQDDSLLPLSFYGDLLHAWPEYYDRARELWHPIDPTWGDTARLDYLSSFDLSHIAFVYHGTSSETPYPPGVYKTNRDSKDVYVSPTSSAPPVRYDITATAADKFIFFGSNKQVITLGIVSESNVFQYHVPVVVKNQGREIAQTVIDIIAPYEHIKVDVPITPPKTTFKQSGDFSIVVNDVVVATRPYEAYGSVLALAYAYWIYLALFGIVVVLVVLIALQSRR
ncbi:MAG: hypothetical protein NUV52_03640 [Candidatus Roizmanbacteria bacterium]|nr:hypothetical protein [Candidatus Roizmanbacteria bacterium]